MVYILEALYRDDLPFEAQHKCAEEFFNTKNDYWKHNYKFLPPAEEASDEESVNMINYVLTNEHPQGLIKEMLISWKEEGF